MPKNPEAERIIKSCSDLNNERAPLLSTLQDIADYISPRKNMILNKRSVGTKSPVMLYDSTAEHAAILLANSLQGAFAMSWFSQRYADEELNKDEESVLWLDEAVKRMYRAINKSNLSTEGHETILDVVVLATGCLLIEEKTLEKKGFNGLRFKAFAIDEYVIDENAEGFADTVIRNVSFTARQAVQEYGDKAGKEALMSIKKEPYRMIKYLRAAFPAKESYYKIPDKFKYADITVSENEGEIIKKSGYHEFPYAVPRWSKVSNEKYGRGPGETALSFAKGLNKTREEFLKALAIDLNPPLLTPETVGKLKRLPGSQNNVRHDLIDKIKPLPTNARHDVVQYSIADERQAIKEIFFTDQLQMQKKAQMTATESTITFELMERLLGPTYGRLSIELFEPIVNRVFGLMLRSGALGVPPKITHGRAVDVEYVGPLARAQKQSEIQGINSLVTLITSMQGSFPNVVDALNADKAVKNSAKAFGVAEEILNSDEAIAETRKKRADAEDAAQQQQALIEGAKAFPNVAKSLNALKMGGGI